MKTHKHFKPNGPWLFGLTMLKKPTVQVQVLDYI